LPGCMFHVVHVLLPQKAMIGGWLLVVGSKRMRQLDREQ